MRNLFLNLKSSLNFNIFNFSFLVYELSTCGNRGMLGPSPDDCSKFYNNTEIASTVRVNEKAPHKGVQIWKVPSEGYYT